MSNGKEDSKPLSLGGALARGIPVVFTGENQLPQVVCIPGKEKEALELMDKMGLIKLIRPVKGDIHERP